MSCFVDFVTLYSKFVATRRDDPEDPVHERDLMNADLETEDNEDNEEESNSLSFYGESAPRCAIISGATAPANSLQSNPKT
jgi:hypothetical protein